MARYYKTGYVRESILKQAPTIDEIDTRKYKQRSDNLYPPPKGTEEQYKEFGLHYYRSYNEFFTSMANLTRDFSKRLGKPTTSVGMINKWYEEYIRRDYLLANNLYRNALYNAYKESFVEGITKRIPLMNKQEDMELMKRIRHNISKLSPNEFDRIMRDADKVSNANNFLKELFRFYSAAAYSKGDDLDVTSYEEGLSAMFAKNFIPYDTVLPKEEEEQDITTVQPRKIYGYRKLYNKDYSFVSSNLYKLVNTATLEDLQQLPDIPDEAKAGFLLSQKNDRRYKDKKALYMKPYKNKEGYYVPFMSRKESQMTIESYFKYLTYINK